MGFATIAGGKRIRITSANPPEAKKFCICCTRSLTADTGKRLRHAVTGAAREFHKPCAVKIMSKVAGWVAL